MKPIIDALADADRPHTVWLMLRGRRVRCLALAPSGLPLPSTRPPLPLLLVHGLAGSGAVWGPLLGALHRSGTPRPIFAPDLPGSGRSDGSQGPLGVDGMADWLAELLDARGVGWAHVLGHSLGCQVALALARRHPARVGGLVLSGPTLGCRVPLWRYALGALDVLREPPVFNRLALGMSLQMGPRRYWEAVGQMRRDDPLEGIGAVRAPCLILRGTRDAVIPDASARLLTARLPRGTYQMLPGAPHVAPYTAPAAVLQRALPFLADTEAAQIAP